MLPRKLFHGRFLKSKSLKCHCLGCHYNNNNNNNHRITTIGLVWMEARPVAEDCGLMEINFVRERRKEKKNHSEWVTH